MDHLNSILSYIENAEYKECKIEIYKFYDENDENITNLHKKILNKISNIKQRTPEWKQARKYGIGGSSMAVITGDNIYTNLRKFLYEKAEVVENNINLLYTEWGNMFEDVIKQYTEIIYETEIYYDDSYIQHNKYIYCSVDGVGLIKIGDSVKQALFEFKAPFCRVMTGSVPEYYKPQVKMGIDICDVDIGIYIEMMFRKCAFENWDFSNKYDKSFGQKSDGKPSAIGLIGFRFNKGAVNATNTTLGTFIKMCYDEFDQLPDGESFIDFGGCSKHAFITLLKMLNLNIITCKYSDIIFKNPNDDNDIEMLKDNELMYLDDCFAIMPWKMFRADVHTINKIDNYVSKYSELINEVGELLESMDGESKTIKKMKIDEFIL